MKALLILLIILLPSSHYFAQTLMTIGEVYDFEIGDEFHYRNGTLDPFPNKDRITVTSKSFSSGMDTVFYEFHHDSYYADYVATPTPHVEYTFWNLTETKFYTNLNTSIGSQTLNIWGFSQDTVIEIDQCSTEINGYVVCPDSIFDYQCYKRKFGRGLGLTKDYEYDASTPATLHTDLRLVYYKKSGIECGTDDNAAVSLKQLTTNEHPSLVKVMDLLGRETVDKPNEILIHLYSDGTSKRIYRIE